MSLTRIPSSYGRACSHCARNKSKCNTREGEARCERCQRLSKECRPSATIRRRNLKRPAASTTERLEEKIDGLMSMFQAQPALSIVGGVQATALGLDYHEPRRRTSSASGRKGSGTSGSSQTVLTPGTSAYGSTTGSPADSPACTYEPSLAAAEDCLHVFCTKHLKYFPFVHISAETTAERLHQERPFLWLCIMAICSKIVAQQEALSKRIQNIVAQRLLYESDYSLDLLLGLLAFIGWSNLQVHTKINLSLYAHLAETMVLELSLNKPKPKGDQLILCTHSQTYYKPPPRSMEERRVLLGCFLVTSIISSFVQRIDALRWTPHCEECLQVLSTNPEGLNDETLVQQVRLQLMVEKVGHWQEETMNNSEHIKTPSSFYMQALKLQLGEIKTKISFSSHPKVLLAHLHSTSLTINETALSQLPIASSNSNFQQLECLYTCVDSIKSWFDVFFTIPPGDYIGFSYSIFSQLSRCLITLYKLSSLEDPSWPKPEVRKTADLFWILEKVINNLSQASMSTGLDSSDIGEDIFTITAKRFRSIKSGWETKLDVDAVMATSGESMINTAPLYDYSAEFPHSEWPTDDWFADIFLTMNT